MVAGAFGPWATWLGGFGEANGFDRGDGSYVLLAAIAAVLLLAWTTRASLATRWASTVAAGMGGVGLFVFFTNWRDFEELKRDNTIIGVLSDLDLINPGWGIYAVGAGSLVLLVCAVGLAVAGPARASRRAASVAADR